MENQAVNDMVRRLLQAGPLTTERFASLLKTRLLPSAGNPHWQTYTFALDHVAFAAGELRLNTAGDRALLILAPRDPPGLTRANVDRATLGTMLSLEPNPDIPPEGVVSEHFERQGVRVSLQWTSRSHRLRSLVLRWEPPQHENAPR